MRAKEFIVEYGRVINGVNTTVDVDVNEITTQAAKFGFDVDKDGRPPLIYKKRKTKNGRK